MNKKKRTKKGAVYILRRALIIPEKRVVYVVSIVAYQDRCRPHKRRNWIFTHVGLSAHARQEVEVHGWLLSGIEEFTILLLLFF